MKKFLAGKLIINLRYETSVNGHHRRDREIPVSVLPFSEKELNIDYEDDIRRAVRRIRSMVDCKGSGLPSVESHLGDNDPFTYDCSCLVHVALFWKIGSLNRQLILNKEELKHYWMRRVNALLPSAII